MNHIFYIMGKSASGKDRIYRELLRDFEGRLEKNRALYHASHAGGGEGRTGIFFCG